MHELLLRVDDGKVAELSLHDELAGVVDGVVGESMGEFRMEHSVEEVGGWVGGWVDWLEGEEAVKTWCCRGWVGGWVGGLPVSFWIMHHLRNALSSDLCHRHVLLVVISHSVDKVGNHHDPDKFAGGRVPQRRDLGVWVGGWVGEWVNFHSFTPSLVYSTSRIRTVVWPS